MTRPEDDRDFDLVNADQLIAEGADPELIRRITVYHRHACGMPYWPRVEAMSALELLVIEEQKGGVK